jgi:hypothetical protein
MSKEDLKKTGEAILESAARLREHIAEQLELVAKLERQGELRVLGVDAQEIATVSMHTRPKKSWDDGKSKVTMKNGDTHIVPTRFLFESDPFAEKH